MRYICAHRHILYQSAQNEYADMSRINDDDHGKHCHFRQVSAVAAAVEQRSSPVDKVQNQTGLSDWAGNNLFRFAYLTDLPPDFLKARIVQFDRD